MRVLYVLHQFYPKYVSGTEQYVLSLATAGRAAGDDVRVFALDPDFRDQDPPRELRVYDYRGVPTTMYRFDKSAIRNYVLTDYDNPEVGQPFRELLDAFQPEVVHFFHFRWNGLDRIDDVEARGIPFCVHLMDFWFVCPNFLLLRPDGQMCDGPPDSGLGCFECVYQETGAELDAAGGMDAVRARFRAGERACHSDAAADAGLALMQRLPAAIDGLARADCVFCPSETVRRIVLSNGHRPRRLEVTPYGIDFGLLEHLPALPAEPVTLGFVGTLAPHKGADLLIQAFVELADARLRLRVHGRFGDYPDFDDKLRELSKRDPRIELAGGFARADLANVLGGLHAVIVPSRWRENTPFVCLEARAAGLPVLTSDLAGMTEAVPIERGGTFRTGDVADLAQKLEALIATIRARGGARLAPDRSIPAIHTQYAAFRRAYTTLGGRN